MRLLRISSFFFIFGFIFACSRDTNAPTQPTAQAAAEPTNETSFPAEYAAYSTNVVDGVTAFGFILGEKPEPGPEDTQFRDGLWMLPCRTNTEPWRVAAQATADKTVFEIDASAPIGSVDLNTVIEKLKSKYHLVSAAPDKARWEFGNKDYQVSVSVVRDKDVHVQYLDFRHIRALMQADDAKRKQDSVKGL